MKRITVFSALTDGNEQTVLEQIFPTEISSKALAYMPSSGIEDTEDYIRQWESIAQKYGAKFNVINNRLKSVEEQKKLLASNILVISGGNTFDLLHNLRRSGLDQSIKHFLDKPDFVLAGFSAGAIVLTPSIGICDLPDFDENRIDLQDLAGLGVVNFEIFPHYNQQLHQDLLKDYQKTTNNRVRKLTDEDYICIDL